MDHKKHQAMEKAFENWLKLISELGASEKVLAQAAFEAGFQSGSDFLD